MKLLGFLKRVASDLMNNSANVVTMNARNLHYIYPNNARKHFPLADDKLMTKAYLEPNGIAVPKTYGVYSHFFELENLRELLESLEGFVIKPAQGSGGRGIIVIVGKQKDLFLTAGGKTLDLQSIKNHIGDILFGVHSVGMNDRAILEERLIQHDLIERVSPNGLADIRVICYDRVPAIAMLRVATKASDGKANLHQGGAGIAIEMQQGVTTHASIKGKAIERHPDTDVPLLGLQIPFWEAIKELSVGVAASVPLNYLGIDIALTQEGPVVLEINVRPGLEIQNVNQQGMRPILENIR